MKQYYLFCSAPRFRAQALQCLDCSIVHTAASIKDILASSTYLRILALGRDFSFNQSCGRMARRPFVYG